MCGHVFQNPRLTIDGLDFYYRDFYDGVGETELELVFSTGQTSYDGRVAIVEPHAAPKRWLDVGTGHGHFCLIAKGRWPEATFDGLDLGDGVEEAERRGWIDVGYQGMFPELADSLREQYDVVSMHHYLEHTREPADELDAAATVLAPGGHLLIELPDPSSRLGRKLGKWWGPYFQPQHQHMMSVDTLQQLLGDRAFEIVTVERSEPHQPCDFVFATYLLLNRLGPARDAPWMPPPTAAGKARRAAVFALGSPLIALGLAIDHLGAPVVARTSSNTFRVLARKAGAAET
jgi:SAM-dependent methyltransferase